MTYDITIQHTLNGKVQATKTCTITADNERSAKDTALEMAGSIQSGMFRMMVEGEHLLEVIKSEITKD